MAEVAFSTLVPRLYASVPGCPQPTMLTHLRDAAIQVCERTLAYRYKMPAVTMVADTYGYDFDVPVATEVHAIFAATSNDCPLDLLTMEQATDAFPEWISGGTTNASSPRAVAQINGDQFNILPVPDDATTYEVAMFLALKPLRTATTMDEVPLGELEDVIVHRALQTLLTLPAMPWTNFDLATYHAKQFTFFTSERRARANLGNARGSMRVRANPLA